MDQEATDDGTTLFFYTSLNGKDWLLTYSQTRATHTIVPDEIGLFMIADHATYDSIA